MNDQYSLHTANCLLSVGAVSSNVASKSLEEYVRRILELSVTDKEDQLLLLLGPAGSGKTMTFNSIRNLLLQNSELVKGVRDADAILNAFGNVCDTEEHFDASKFGKYVEYQYNSDGTFLGIKLLDFFLQKQHIYSGQPFHIFNHLIAGATPAEKVEWDLSETHRYLGVKEKGSIKTGSHIIFNALRKQLKAIGCGPRMQQGLFQVLSAILHLGDINFEITNIQETCKIKNPVKCASAARLLGCKQEELETALITKSTVIGTEKCSIILGTFEAARQRNQLASLLYTLIFSWLVEQINKKFCVQDELVSQFIGVFDFPGILPNRSAGYGFEQLLVNYMSESLDYLAKFKLCDKSWMTYDENDLNDFGSSLKKVDDQFEILDLLGNLKTGLLPRFYAKKPTYKELNSISHKNAYLVPDRKRKLPTYFAIRHFTGTVDYRISDLDTLSDSFVGADFVSLFSNAINSHSSPNVSFIRQLFNKKIISVEFDPTSPRTVLKANTSNAPNRSPSYKNRKEASLLLSDNETETPVSKLMRSFNQLLNTSSEVPCHIVYHFNDKGKDDTRGLFGTFGLETLGQSLSGQYFTSLPHAEFLYRYSESNPRFEFSRSSKDECDLAINELGWNDQDAVAGKFRVFLTYDAWKSLSMKHAKHTDKDTGDIASPMIELLKSEDCSEDGTTESSLTDPVEEFYMEDRMAVGVIPDLESGKGTRQKIFDSIKPIQPSKWRYPAEMSRQRKVWVTCTWMLTWCIPSGLLKLFKQKTPEIRMAFREKLALYILILSLCTLMLFFIIGIGPLTCPNQNVYSAGEVSAYSSMSNPLVIINGYYYYIPDIVQTHVMGGSYTISATTFQSTVLGQDVSGMFYPTDSFAENCPGFEKPTGWDNIPSREAPGSANNIWYAHLIRREGQTDYLSQIAYMKKGYIARDDDWIKNKLSSDQLSSKILVAWDRVYDVTNYYTQYNIQNNGSGFMGPYVKQIFDTYAPFGKDATSGLMQLSGPSFGGTQFLAQVRYCLDSMFFVGVIDHRKDVKCLVGNYVLLASSIVLFLVISIKFVASLQFGSAAPEEQDKFVIIQVPCYTEGYESLLKTFASIAKLDYDSQRKLLFVVCDGMMIGHGNDRPTPRIVLDILGVDPYNDPEAVAYRALGEGTKQMNCAKVYSGLYKTEDQSIPFVVVIKVGKPSERQRPGNRGKRDSQLILLNYLNHVYYKADMSPLEVTLYDHMKNNIGIHPFLYEYIFMIDADTEVYPDSLKRLVSSMVHDSRIMGICGETRMANEKASWVTMIQVYEYFISHHMAKAFESLFGCVTCLPGCFSLYRIRNVVKNKPVLISDQVLQDYSANDVNTLHLKNLLELGEDRYLTTLLLKHFPLMKTTFNPDAVCLTMAPDRWSILLSQRRRWINSTVHNLFELLLIPQLCGFCCFSMRFIVLIDLFGTILQPSALIYLGYIIYKAVTDTHSAIPVISLVMIGCIYGFQLTIIFIKREFHYIGWMMLYILAIPLSSFLIPLYSFWHFDDFSWGNTRKVFDSDMKAYIADPEEFDINCIPSLPYPDSEKFPEHPKFKQDDTEGVSEKPRTLNGEERSEPTPHQSRISLTPAPSATLSNPIHIMYQPMYQPMYPPMTAIQAMNLHSDLPIVTNDLLLKELRRILEQSDLEKMTKKKIRSSLAQIFQVNLDDRKAFINMCIDKILEGEM